MKRHPGSLLIALGLIVVLVVAGSIVWFLVAQTGGDPAQTATVRASSSAPGHSAAEAVRSQGGWRSEGQAEGAWIELRWAQPQELRSFALEPVPSGGRVTAGVLQFSDGSVAQIAVPAGRGAAFIPFGRRSVRAVRLTVTAATSGATSVGVRALRLNSPGESVVQDPDGDAAATAVVRASHGGVGEALRGAARSGSGWSTTQPTRTVLSYRWEQPRELAAVELVGAATGPGISRATVRFEGGGSVVLGAVRTDPALSTEVAFAPRAVRSMTIAFDAVDGPGAVGLTAVHLWERGHDASPVPHGPDGMTTALAPAAACAGSDEPAQGTRPQVRCPQVGSVVGDEADLAVALPIGATGARAEVWPATGEAVAPVVQRSGSRSIRLPLRLGALPSGPMTVRVTATGPVDASSASVAFQLVHRGLGLPKTAPAPARGRSLVWAEEFDGPVSISRIDRDRRYAAGKPEPDGWSDFGDAGFADPSAATDGVGAVEGALRLPVSPMAARSADGSPAHSGAMLASAQPGGAGFSAQYGYFEARMLVPANPGTWPAFWLLPSTNLISAQPVVAEIDAAELYGHDPRLVCSTTHSYSAAKDRYGVARCTRPFADERAAAQWHTYGVDVGPATVRYFVDGREVARARQVPGGSAPMLFLADLALGGGWPVDLSGVQQSGQMYVDWVHVSV